MIELIVAMVLLAVLLGGVSMAVMRGFEGAGTTSLKSRTFTQFEQASQMLEQDVRAARSPNRSFDQVRDLDLFADQVRTGSSAIADVTVANSKTFQFVGDVVSLPGNATWAGAECIRWELKTGATWSIVRTVYSNDNCGGGTTLTSTWVRPTSGAGAGAGAAPTSAFSYVLGCDPAACGVPAATSTCGQGGAALGTVSGAARNWITQVRFDLSAIAVEGKRATKDSLQSTIALRNRLSSDYQYALGCQGVMQ
ncbi:MAG: hypothetical protein KDC46_07490 [Thermoleophilia bacterium]|nr:hypothetical protein [Thermoleophilia bacterium]